MGVLFDNDRVDVPDSPSLRPDSLWSAAMWMKPTTNWSSSSGRVDIWWKTVGWGFLYDWQNGQLSWLLSTSGHQSFTTTFTAGQWYHIAGVLESSGGNSRLYIDGVEVASGGTFSIGGASNPLSFGQKFDGGSPADVTLAECCCGPKALTTAEVKQLWAAGQIVRNMPLAVFGSALEGYWRLEDGPQDATVTATVVRDSSGNGHHQTAVAGTPVFAATPAGTLGAAPLIVQAPPVVVGGPFPHYIRRRQRGGMIGMGV